MGRPTKQIIASEEERLRIERLLKVSTESGFTSKVADVVGLYLAPPENALVLSLDEKPNIQTLERRTCYAVNSDRRLVQGYESTYKRQEKWLAAHPKNFFHYTPTSASWLNMVEIWFGLLKLRSLAGSEVYGYR